MKKFTAIAAAAALLAGISVASAQNTGGPAPSNASPSNINKGGDAKSESMSQSGNESTSTTTGGHMKKQAASKHKKSMTTGSGNAMKSQGGGDAKSDTNMVPPNKQ